MTLFNIIIYGILAIFAIFTIISFIRFGSSLDSWQTLYPDSTYEPEVFYNTVIEMLFHQKIPGFKTAKRNFKQGGILSRHQLYLEITRGNYRFHICAAPWGDGYFFSWWMKSRFRTIGDVLRNMPIIGKHLRKIKYETYYKADTDTMFRTSVHQCVTDAIDHISSVKGEIRKLTDFDKKHQFNRYLAPTRKN